jgi:hypothetical protein
VRGDSYKLQAFMLLLGSGAGVVTESSRQDRSRKCPMFLGGDSSSLSANSKAAAVCGGGQPAGRACAL